MDARCVKNKQNGKDCFNENVLFREQRLAKRQDKIILEEQKRNLQEAEEKAADEEKEEGLVTICVKNKNGNKIQKKGNFNRIKNTNSPKEYRLFLIN
jgi:hypothetical protein